MNARKRKDEAAAALAKGKLDKAAQLYTRLANEFADDAQMFVRLGEVQRKRGRNREAISAWLAAGRRFTRDGHLIRAIAAYKLVLEVEPGHEEGEALLAELHARRLGRPLPNSTPAGGTPLPTGPAAPGAVPPIWPPPSGQRAPPAPPPPEFSIAIVSGGAPEPRAVPAAPVAVHRFPSEPTDAPGLDELLFDVEVDTHDIDGPPGRLLPEIPLFAELDPEAFRRLIARCRHLHLAPGDRAVSEGERGDSFFVVVRGELEVVRGADGAEVRLGDLREGAFFGEIALLTGSPRTASVRAVQESELLQFTAADLRDLVRQYESVAGALRRFYRQRLLANALATAPLFRSLDPASRAELIGRFRTREVAAGEAVIAGGVLAEGLFVVLHGTFDVVRPAPGGERVLGTLREGDLFGEQSMLHGGPAGATCRARSRGMVLRLPREEFGALIESHPPVRAYLDRLDAERQRRNAGGPPAGGGAIPL